MNEYYAYIYYDPSRNHEPFYVGKGKGTRAWIHLNPKTNTYAAKYIAKHSVKPIIGIYGGLDEELALLVERELISKFGRLDRSTGSLINRTDGGQGVSGLVRKPMSQAHKDAIRRANLGSKRSPETREKLRLAAIERGKNPQYRAKLSAASKGHTVSDEQRAKISAALIGKPGAKHTAESKAKISATLKGRKHSEETKAKIRAKRAQQTAEGRLRGYKEK